MTKLFPDKLTIETDMAIELSHKMKHKVRSLLLNSANGIAITNQKLRSVLIQIRIFDSFRVIK